MIGTQYLLLGIRVEGRGVDVIEYDVNLIISNNVFYYRDIISFTNKKQMFILLFEKLK